MEDFMLFSKDFLMEYFKTKSQRGYYIGFKSHPKPLYRKNSLLHNKLWEGHINGKITLFLTPCRKDYCSWATLDFDVLKKGETLTLDALNKHNTWHPYTLKWCLNKIGLSENNYLFILNGRGFHLHFFFDCEIPSSTAYDFLVALKKLFESEYYDATGVEINWSIDLRPEKPDNPKYCIQLPGYNFNSKRFSIPFMIDNKGIVKELKSIPSIKRIPISQVLATILEFKKGL
jgi:hypothetical protein